MWCLELDAMCMALGHSSVVSHPLEQARHISRVIQPTNLAEYPLLLLVPCAAVCTRTKLPRSLSHHVTVPCFAVLYSREAVVRFASLLLNRSYVRRMFSLTLRAAVSLEYIISHAWDREQKQKEEGKHGLLEKCGYATQRFIFFISVVATYKVVRA